MKNNLRLIGASLIIGSILAAWAEETPNQRRQRLGIQDSVPVHEIQFALQAACYGGHQGMCLINNVPANKSVTILGSSGTKCLGHTGMHRTLDMGWNDRLPQTPVVTTQCDYKSPALSVAVIGPVRSYESLELKPVAPSTRQSILKRLDTKKVLPSAWEGIPEGVNYPVRNIEIQRLDVKSPEIYIATYVQSDPTASHVTYRRTAVLASQQEFILPGLCGKTGPAFRLNDQIYLLRMATGCESGELEFIVFRLSSDALEDVYSNGDLST